MVYKVDRSYLAALVAAVSLLFVTPACAGQALDSAPAKMRAVGWDALQARVKDEKTLNHSLAVEAMMREMAVAKIDDPNQWALAGLLHDIDIATTAGDLSRHGVVGAQILRGLGFSEAVVYAVSAHDDHAGIARKSRLDHALYCADQVYWLIIGTGVRFPSDALKTTSPETVWQQVQAMPQKAGTVSKVSSECAQIDRTMPQVFAAAIAGWRKVPAGSDAR